MLEDLGTCGNKHSEALVQPDTFGEGLNNQNSGTQSLSGRIWSDELDNVLKDLKQMETMQKVEELIKTVQDTKPGLIEAVKTDQELQRILNREMLTEKLSGLLKRDPEIIDCGFDKAFERQGKAKTDESLRRLEKIDLKPYFWNQLDTRR